MPWYDRFYIVALQGNVNLGFSVRGLSQQNMSLLEGKLMRHIKFHSLEEIDEDRATKLLKLVAEKGESCQPH